MNNPFSDFSEMAAEQGRSTVKKVVQEVKSVAKIAKQQVGGQPKNLGDKGDMGDKGDGGNVGLEMTEKIDPVTGKPIPSKQAVSKIAQLADQLRIRDSERVRQELEKIRNSFLTEQKNLAGAAPGQGPEIKQTPEDKKPKEAAVVTALKRNKGEFKGGE